MSILRKIEKSRSLNQTLIAQLIDPDFVKSFDHLTDILHKAELAKVDLLFLGGSMIHEVHDFNIAKAIKEISTIPLVLFPSSPSQITSYADAILFLSLISGRNPEYLIGNQVLAAPILKKTNLEVLPTGYVLVSCGRQTTAEYMSNTASIPYNKTGIAVSTALAGQFLGHRLIYLDGGSGADKPISVDMVRSTKNILDIPLIVGGGIRSVEDAQLLRAAGADVLVIGNGAEESPEFISELCAKMK